MCISMDIKTLGWLCKAFGDITFLELVDEFNGGKDNYVYSFNHQTKKIEPKLITKA